MGAGAAGASNDPGASAFRGVQDAYGDLRASRGIDPRRRTGHRKDGVRPLGRRGPHAGAVFDYHVTFDEEDTSVAGTARWGELPTAAPVDSDDGQSSWSVGGRRRREEFERNLDRVKEAIGELSDEGSCATRTSRGTPSTRSVRTTARRSSCTPNTEPAFATVDSWTDSSRRVKDLDRAR